MRFWSKPDGSVRWLVVIGLLEVVSTAAALHEYGARNLHWVESLSLAVACLAAVPLDEPPRKSWPWQQQLRSPNGILAGLGFAVFLGLSVWLIARGR